MTPLRILETAPPGLAAITINLDGGVATIDSPGRVAIACAQPVTVSDGSGQVIGSWFDTLARPRVVEFTGTITVTGTGLMAVWNSTRTTGTPYTPSMSNYLPSSWSITNGSAVISASTAGPTPGISITGTGISPLFINANGVSTLNDGINTSTLTANALVVAPELRASSVVDTPEIHNGVPGTTPGVFCNDQLRVGNTLTLNGPITSTSTTANNFAGNITAPTFVGALTGTASYATNAGTAVAAGAANTANSSAYITSFAGATPGDYTSGQLHSIAYNGTGTVYFSFIWNGTSYRVPLGGVENS